MVYNNLVEMGIWPIESVVKVDDTVKGCQEAVNAGCWGVAVSDYSSHMNIDSLEAYEEMSEKEQEACKQMSIKKLMEESGAHYIIDTIVELPEVIKDINERLACGEKP
jgi:phosphonoacetaldehyde hydrolase